MPDFHRFYATSKEAYEFMFELAKGAEPNVEYYDDGRIGIETRLYGRVDLWWVVLEVAACIRSSCSRLVGRAAQKRRMILLPGERD